MSEPAKDEANIVEIMAKAHRDCWRDREGLRAETRDWPDITGGEHLDCIAQMEAALAAIRAAGWAVVPVALLEEAASTLESLCDIEHIHRDRYPDEQRRYDRDMEFPKSIRLMIAAAPGVKS